MNAYLIWLLAAFAAPAAAPAAPATPPAALPMSDAEAAAVHRAEERGVIIYAYDQAAWHGTDDLAAKMPDLATRIGGWIVDGPKETPEIVFFDKDEADPHAVYVADFRDNHLVSSKLLGPNDDRTLSESRKRLIAARRTATQALVRSGLGACKPQPFNTVVLPPATPGGSTLVYFLTPQTRTDAVPLGGHFLVEVGPDGKAGAPRRFTNSCLEMPLNPPGQARPVGLGVSHLLDPVPTEIHVFTSLTIHMPLFVDTEPSNSLWEVDGTKIRLMTRNVGH
ncbi:MAG TPA: hypothetical protein VFW19_04965 [Allosphingosinicella sp.]|nr:hypothetical protein [Allosphingosinicella sp.]